METVDKESILIRGPIGVVVLKKNFANFVGCKNNPCGNCKTRFIGSSVGKNRSCRTLGSTIQKRLDIKMYID